MVRMSDLVRGGSAGKAAPAKEASRLLSRTAPARNGTPVWPLSLRMNSSAPPP